MTASPQQPSTVEAALLDYRTKIAGLLQDHHSHGITTAQLTAIDRQAISAINELRQSELEKARMSGAKLQLLHLKTWINLHGLDKPMIMKGIDHMSQSIEQQMLGEVSVEPHWKERLNEPE